MATRYTVSDGKLVLNLEMAEEGGYVVTSPLDPELITEADTIDDAFANARDAAQALNSPQIIAGFPWPELPTKKSTVTSPDLERHLRRNDCVLHHHGGNHDVWLNRTNLRRHQSRGTRISNVARYVESAGFFVFRARKAF